MSTHKVPTEVPIDPEVSAESIENRLVRYSVSLVTQGKHRFYTLTLPSDVLAKTCFVTTREEDPAAGFQRLLDKDRAQQIADYIDSGPGTIPNSIVLSAQPEAEVRDVGKGKTVEFRANRKAFLVIDGQHRVYGFSLAKTRLRVPVVIYNGLSKRDESRLFIDINTKQKPVPNELLLDIKKLAEYETDAEQLFGEVFDFFHEEPASPLFGLTSPISRSKGKISRVTFNAAMKPLLGVFEDSEAETVYNVLAAYLLAFRAGAVKLGVGGAITNPIVLRAAMQLFPEVGSRIKDKSQSYSVDNFAAVLKPIFDKIKPSELTHPPQSHRELFDILSSALRKSFTL
jgi:DGQHR domain-containing protein